MDDDVSLISAHPFVRAFVFSIIRTTQKKNFGRDDRFVIDAEMVPRVSDDVMMASMGAGVVVPVMKESILKPRIVRKDMSVLVAPIGNQISKNVKQRVVPPMRVAPPVRYSPTIVPVRVPVSMPVPVIAGGEILDEGGEYGKISPLLNDNSISTIECSGEGKEIMVIRAGQKQKTRIILSAKEIREILERIADKTHIPLLDGVFRVTLAGFSVNAVISEMIGSRFVIKKTTAYKMLE